RQPPRRRAPPASRSARTADGGRFSSSYRSRGGSRTPCVPARFARVSVAARRRSCCFLSFLLEQPTLPALLSGTGITLGQQKLCASKERYHALIVLTSNGRVPNLSPAPAVDHLGLAPERSFCRRSEEVRLELYRREAAGAVGERCQAAHPGRGVRDRDHGRGVQEVVWGEMLRPQVEARLYPPGPHVEQLESEQAGQPALHGGT